ncbi:hypothetical protein [Actinomycetospora termitidis]|uniref:Uncharacterized protein n=1 Tax=Actinomycetospora termitidis TaxID=3053470 RepID=A0ABT7MG05_9PSEU|nr:hypothetical protein [Actinomycetospora sp. Odt1-22]MDL5159590.1 hypothetical protein [Actinomycetospora sp. Odt1-22]
MGTLYRAIWASDDPAAVELADDAFTRWAERAAERDHRPLADTGRIRTSKQDRYTLRRDVHRDPTDTKITAIVRAVFIANRRDGIRWTTTLRTWSGGTAEHEGARAWVWVDVDASSHHPNEPIVPRPPIFVSELLTSTKAGRHGVVLRPTPMRYRGPDGAEELADLVTHADRDVPVVVLADLGEDVPVDEGRVLDAVVRRTVRDVAGLAAVAVVDPDGGSALADALGEDAPIGPGGLRVYLPGFDPAAGDDTADRLLDVRADRYWTKPGLAGRLVAGLVAPLSTARRPPDSYDRARAHLDAQAPAEVGATLEKATARIADLEQDLAAERSLSEGVIQEYGDLEHEVASLRDQLRTLSTDLARLRGERADAGLEDLDVAPVHARDCSDAAALARKHLGQYLSFPTAAGVDLELLDRQSAGAAWGEQAWRALRALAWYARARSRDGVEADFFQWCWNSGHPMAWPASPRKLAMRESKSVMDRWPDTRTFDVDGEPRIVESHIKISSAGLAPRIYFTWVERTRTVHVVYFGRHLRNTMT